MKSLRCPSLQMKVEHSNPAMKKVGKSPSSKSESDSGAREEAPEYAPWTVHSIVDKTTRPDSEFLPRELIEGLPSNGFGLLHQVQETESVEPSKVVIEGNQTHIS